MPIASLNTSGEIKIPQNILERLHLRAGDKIELDVARDGTVRLWPKRRKVAEVRGLLAGKTRVSATVEEMDAAVAEGFRTGQL